MKNYLTLFTAFIALVCASCEKDESKSEPTFTLETPEGNNPSLITIDEGNYSKQFAVKSNASWKIEKPEADAWLTVKPVSGQGNGSISVSAPASDLTDFRQTTLTCSADGKEFLRLTIKQKPKTPFITVAPESPDVISAKGEEVVLTVTTNMEKWEYALTGESTGWLTEKAKDATSLTLTAAKNATDDAQTATVVFSVTGRPDLKQEVVLKQEAQKPPYLKVTPAAPENIPGKGGDLALTVDTNLDEWEYAITGENSGWLTEKSKDAAGVVLTAARSTLETEQTATVVFTAPGNPDVKQEIVVKQNPKEPATLYIEPEELDNIPTKGGTLKLTVVTNVDVWEYTITGENSGWLTEKAKNATSVTFGAGENLSASEQTATIVFTAPGYPEIKREVVIKQNGLTADLLDIVFSNDGSASDVSPMKNTVQTLDGPTMTTVYSNAYQRYIGRFDAEQPGVTKLSSGFCKVDYTGNQAFKDALSDGHSMEMVVMLNSDLSIGNEVKMFSSMQGGGTGFLLKRETNEFTFLPNIGGWKWATSGVAPEKGTYYHVVGVWNKAEGKAYIYINGELKGETDAAGNFSFPNTDACHWFCIGGDPANATEAENCWKGDIAVARVYGDPLSPAQVAKLYEEVNKAK